jgi:hypothetical protein
LKFLAYSGREEADDEDEDDLEEDDDDADDKRGLALPLPFLRIR